MGDAEPVIDFKPRAGGGKVREWWRRLTGNHEQREQDLLQGERVASCVDRGWTYLMEGDTDLAGTALRQAVLLLEKRSRNSTEQLLLARAYLLLGHVHFHTENYTEAVLVYGKGIEHASRYGPLKNQLGYYRICLGRTFSKQKNPETQKVLEEYGQAVPQHLTVEQHSSFLRKLANAYCDLFLQRLSQETQVTDGVAKELRDMLNKARSAWKEAVALQPDDDDQSDGLGALDYFEAKLEAQRDKSKVKPFLDLARRRFESLTAGLETTEEGSPQREKSLLRKAVAQSDLASTQEFLAGLSDAGPVRRQYYEDAERNLREALRCTTDANRTANSRLNLIGFLTRAERYEAAIQEWQEFFDLLQNSDADRQRFKNQLADFHSQQADAYLQIKNYDEAIGGYNKSIELAGTASAQASLHWNQLGSVHLEKAEPKRAVECFQSAVALSSKPDPVFYWNLGNALYQDRQFQSAAEAWEKAVALDKENADYLNWLGRAYREVKEYEKAAAAYQSAINKKADPVFLQNLGNVLLDWNKPGDALPVYQKLIEADGGQWNSHYLLGLAYRRLPDNEHAAQEYFSALRLAPQDDMPAQKKVRRSLGFLFQSAGYYNDAVPYLEWVWDRNLEQGSPDMDVQLSLAECYAYLGRADETLAQLTAARKANPADQRLAQEVLDNYKRLSKAAKSDVEWLVLLGWGYLQTGAFRKAIKHLDAAAKLTPEDATVYFELGNAYAGNGDHLQAGNAFARAAQLQPKQAEHWHRLGLENLAFGNFGQAADTLVEAVRLNPGRMDYRRELAVCRERQEDWAEALSVLQQTPSLVQDKEYPVDLANALALHSRYSDAAEAAKRLGSEGDYGSLLVTLRRLADSDRVAERHAAFATVNLKLNRNEAAVAAYRRAAALDPGQVDYHKQLGDVLYKQGDFLGAIEEWQTAVKAKPDDARTINNLGTAYDALEKREDALEQYRRAAALAENFVPFYNAGNACYRLGQTADALAAFEKSLSINGKFAPAHGNRGNCLFRLDRQQEAKKAWERAVELDANLAQAQFNLGVVSWSDGDKEEAKGKWKAALRANRNLAEAEDLLAAAESGGAMDLAILDLNRA